MPNNQTDQCCSCSASGTVATDIHGMHYCESCSTDLYTCCCCRRRMDEDSTVTFRSESWCSECRDERLVSCYSCGHLMYAEDANYNDGNDEYYCDSCYEDDCDEVGIREYHSHRREWRAFGTPDPYLFGVELEMHSPSRNASRIISALGSSRVFIERDGSISCGGAPPGFELITQPHSFAEHINLWRKWETFMKDIPKREIHSHKPGTCGIHIHVGREQLTPLQIGKAVSFVGAEGNASFIEKIAQRGANEYNRRRPKKVTDVQSHDRYEAINLSGDGTIEFRIFRGNVRRDRIMKNIEFVHALLQFCRSAGVREGEYGHFIKWIYPRYRLQYPNLTNYLFETGYLIKKTQVKKMEVAA